MLLTPRQERWLARCVERGGEQAEKAREILVNANLRLVTSIAKKYQNRGIAMEALIQEGVRALLRAVESYDAERGIRFSTYATFWIRRTLGKVVEGKERSLPDHLALLNEDAMPLPESVRRVFQEQVQLQYLRELLSEREVKILTLRYGLTEDAPRPMTREQVGHILLLSQERVQQIEAAALQKLRHSEESDQQSGEPEVRSEISTIRSGISQSGLTEPTIKSKTSPIRSKKSAIRSKISTIKSEKSMIRSEEWANLQTIPETLSGILEELTQLRWEVSRLREEVGVQSRLPVS
jgi:RNA polymerase primary sigma factor